LYCCGYNVAGRKVITGVSKQSVHNNVLTDLFDIVGPRNYSYNRNTGQLRLCDAEWLVIGAVDGHPASAGQAVHPSDRREGPRTTNPYKWRLQQQPTGPR